MTYELRVSGRPSVFFEAEQEAVEAAARLIADNPDADPEIIDQSTGKPAAPGSDRASREDLRNKVGF